MYIYRYEPTNIDILISAKCLDSPYTVCSLLYLHVLHLMECTVLINCCLVIVVIILLTVVVVCFAFWFPLDCFRDCNCRIVSSHVIYLYARVILFSFRPLRPLVSQSLFVLVSPLGTEVTRSFSGPSRPRETHMRLEDRLKSIINPLAAEVHSNP